MDSGDLAEFYWAFAVVIDILDVGLGDFEGFEFDEGNVSAGELAFAEFEASSREVWELLLTEVEGNDRVIPAGFGVAVAEKSAD